MQLQQAYNNSYPIYVHAVHFLRTCDLTHFQRQLLLDLRRYSKAVFLSNSKTSILASKYLKAVILTADCPLRGLYRNNHYYKRY